MEFSKKDPKKIKILKKSKLGNFLLPIVSILIISSTFFTATSELDFTKKLLIYLSSLVFYLIFFIAYYLINNRQNAEEIEINDREIFNQELENQFFALEEAKNYFGASLRTSDMFRLAASRVACVVPHTAAVLILNEKSESNLRIACANGLNVRKFLEFAEISRKGLAGICINSKKIKVDPQLRLERNIFPSEILQDFGSAAAVPLFDSEKNVFGVFLLFGGKDDSFDEKSLEVLEAFGERIAPLISGALAFESNLSKALTDVLTNLPNERAFYLILENQLAEAQRKRDERPLTLLSIDIENFNELNLRYGHAAGDRILNFCAETIKKQLRKMDFLARSFHDEFLVVLPTATESAAQEVIERIERAFELEAIEITAHLREQLKIKIGAATFWKDGESAAQLLRTARRKKNLPRGQSDRKILFFPNDVAKKNP